MTIRRIGKKVAAKMVKIQALTPFQTPLPPPDHTPILTFHPFHPHRSLEHSNAPNRRGRLGMGPPENPHLTGFEWLRPRRREGHLWVDTPLTFFILPQVISTMA